MKIITRTLILLAAALVVVGITWGLSSAGLLAFVGFDDDHDRPVFSQGSSSPGFMPDNTHAEGFRPRGGHGEGRGHHVNNDPSLLGGTEIIKNLILTGIIVALVVLFSRVFNARRASRQGATP